MDWDTLRDFKKQYHLADAAVDSLSVKNAGLNVKAEKDKAIEVKLDLPPENEIARLATLLRPLLNKTKPIDFRSVARILIDSGLIKDQEREELLKAIRAVDNGPVIVKIEDEHITSEELYSVFANGEYFTDNEAASKKLSKFKKNYFLYRYLLYNFVSYNFDVHKICTHLYIKIRELEKGENQKTPLATENQEDQCIYCLSRNGSFTSEEHVYPESLGNSEIILPRGNVCDKCNNEILSGLDDYLVNHDVISFLRVLYVPYNPKTGKFPKAKYQNMAIQKHHPSRIEIIQPKGVTKGIEIIEEGPEAKFKVQLTGRQRFNPEKLGRCLFKIALGLVCWQHGRELALSPRYNAARSFILGQSSFPNNLLIGVNSSPAPVIEGQHWLGKIGTPVHMSIFGLTFFFNIEPAPVIKLSPEIEALYKCFPLFT